MYYTVPTTDERGSNPSSTKEGKMVKREKKQDKAGRPVEYTGPRKPVTVQWPVDLIAYIDSVTENRTKWLIEAAEEKRERERKT